MSDININWLVENFGDKTMNVFDIGSATVDGDSLMFKTILPKSSVYAFECSEVWKEHNMKNAAMHGINYFHMAMSDTNGELTFYPSATYNGEIWPYSGSVCRPTTTEVSTGTFEWGEPYTVETIKLETFCDTHNVTPDFIHMDVQGAEYKVLNSMGKYRPWAIWAEVNEFENCYETNITHAAFTQLLTDLGYTKQYSNNIDELYVLNTLSTTPYYAKT